MHGREFFEGVARLGDGRRVGVQDDPDSSAMRKCRPRSRRRNKLASLSMRRRSFPAAGVPPWSCAPVAGGVPPRVAQRLRLFLDDVLQVQLVAQLGPLEGLLVGDVEKAEQRQPAAFRTAGDDVRLDLDGPPPPGLPRHRAAEGTHFPARHDVIVKPQEVVPEPCLDLPGESLQGRLETRGIPDEAVQGFGPRHPRTIQMDHPGTAGADGVDVDDFTATFHGGADIVAAGAAKKERGGRHAQGLADLLQQVQGRVALAPLDEPEVLLRHIEFDRQLLLGLSRHGAVKPDT